MSHPVRPTLVGMCTLLLTAVAASAQAPVEGAVQELDGGLVAFAVPLVEKAGKVAEVWPGFWSAEPQFMLLRDQVSALLVSATDPGDDFLAVADGSIPAVLQGRAFLRRTYPATLGPRSFSIRFVVGTDTMPALEPFGSSAFSRTDFYLHESFHGYQGAHFTRVPEDSRRVRMGEPLVDPAQISDSFRELVERERLLLLHALQSDGAERLRLLEDYLSIRDGRLQSAIDAAAVELSMERTEGTATYVGCRGAAAALGAPIAAARACISDELRRPLDDMPAMPEADARLMRWRLYGTGGALALLLDDLAVKNWQQRVQAGAALLELLREAVGGHST